MMQSVLSDEMHAHRGYLCSLRVKSRIR